MNDIPRQPLHGTHTTAYATACPDGGMSGTGRASRVALHCGISTGDIAALIRQASHDGTREITLPDIADKTGSAQSASGTGAQVMSAFAIDPIIADLSQPGTPAASTQGNALPLPGDPQNPARIVAPEFLRQEKLRLLRAVFDERGEATVKSQPFKAFLADNSKWLVPHAQYSYLRDAYGTSRFEDWPNHREWCDADMVQLANPRTKAYKKLLFYYYTQYIMHTQMKATASLAAELGVELCCETETGIGRHACDVWRDSGMFLLYNNAGVATDTSVAAHPYAHIYGYVEHDYESEAAQWWRARIDRMGEYFTRVRIAAAPCCDGGAMRLANIAVPKAAPPISLADGNICR